MNLGEYLHLAFCVFLHRLVPNIERLHMQVPPLSQIREQNLDIRSSFELEKMRWGFALNTMQYCTL